MKWRLARRQVVQYLVRQVVITLPLSMSGTLDATTDKGGTMEIDDPVEEMTLDECWEQLEGQESGRLAFRLVDEVQGPRWSRAGGSCCAGRPKVDGGER